MTVSQAVLGFAAVAAILTIIPRLDTTLVLRFVCLPHLEVRGEWAPGSDALERCRGNAGVLLQLLAGERHCSLRPNVPGSTGRFAWGRFSTTSR